MATRTAGTLAWEVVAGAIDFCEEVPSVLEASADWSSAWVSVIDAKGPARLFAGRKQWARTLGRAQVEGEVLIGLQTGEPRDLPLPLRMPRSWA